MGLFDTVSKLGMLLFTSGVRLD
jgi:hypothetical protein